MADQLTDLLKKISSGKATATEKMELSRLLAEQSQQEAEKEREDKIEKIKAFIAEQGFDFEEFLSIFRPSRIGPKNDGPKEEIFKWEFQGQTFTRYTGERGKFPAWVAVMKAKLSESEAYKFALNDKGRDFVKKLYS
jgi:hypothetical protein